MSMIILIQLALLGCWLGDSAASDSEEFVDSESETQDSDSGDDQADETAIAIAFDEQWGWVLGQPEGGDSSTLFNNYAGVTGVVELAFVEPGSWTLIVILDNRCNMPPQPLQVAEGEIATWTHDELPGAFDYDSLTCEMP